MNRRYNKGSLNPAGVPEKRKQCVVSVSAGGFYDAQCSRPRVVGELCRQHHNIQQKGGHLHIPPEPDPELLKDIRDAILVITTLEDRLTVARMEYKALLRKL